MRAILLAVCMISVVGPDARAQQTRAPEPREKSVVKVETVAKGLVHPWGLQFLPDGRMLVTERPGRLRIVTRDGTLSAPIANVPAVFATGQGGLLDVAVDPAFATSGTIYFTFAEPRGAGTAGTSVARAKLVETGTTARLDDVRQGPDGALYLLTDHPEGRVLRVTGE